MAENIQNKSQERTLNAQNEGLKEAKTPGNNAQNVAEKAKKEEKGGTESKVLELTETLQRLQAEFENYQKRSAKQNAEYLTFANAKLIEDLLPVLDSLESGMAHDKALVLVHEQLSAVLKKYGLVKMKIEKGMKFDHDKMECLMQETDLALKEEEVVKVLVSGYQLNGKILRLAKVSVNVLKKTEEKENLKGEEKNAN